jgi:hypothetical protein
MTLAVDFVHKTRDVTDQEISLLTRAMHSHSVSSVPDTKFHLSELTETCLRPEFNIMLSPTASADLGTFLLFGILPADFFEGDTRKERLLNRAIAGIAAQEKCDPEDLFINARVDDNDVFRVECVQCGNRLRVLIVIFCAAI